MSSTELPRLYFDGHFAWNPSTYNNDDYAGGDLTPYDADTDTPNWAWPKQQVFDGNPVDITASVAGNWAAILLYRGDW